MCEGNASITTIITASPLISHSISSENTIPSPNITLPPAIVPTSVPLMTTISPSISPANAISSTVITPAAVPLSSGK